jgi:hypothetical protein
MYTCIPCVHMMHDAMEKPANTKGNSYAIVAYKFSHNNVTMLYCSYIVEWQLCNCCIVFAGLLCILFFFCESERLSSLVPMYSILNSLFNGDANVLHLQKKKMIKTQKFYPR